MRNALGVTRKGQLSSSQRWKVVFAEGEVGSSWIAALHPPIPIAALLGLFKPGLQCDAFAFTVRFTKELAVARFQHVGFCLQVGEVAAAREVELLVVVVSRVELFAIEELGEVAVVI